MAVLQSLANRINCYALAPAAGMLPQLEKTAPGGGRTAPKRWAGLRLPVRRSCPGGGRLSRLLACRAGRAPLLPSGHGARLLLHIRVDILAEAACTAGTAHSAAAAQLQPARGLIRAGARRAMVGPSLLLHAAFAAPPTAAIAREGQGRLPLAHP